MTFKTNPYGRETHIAKKCTNGHLSAHRVVAKACQICLQEKFGKKKDQLAK